MEDGSRERLTLSSFSIPEHGMESPRLASHSEPLMPQSLIQWYRIPVFQTLQFTEKLTMIGLIPRSHIQKRADVPRAITRRWPPIQKSKARYFTVASGRHETRRGGVKYMGSGVGCKRGEVSGEWRQVGGALFNCTAVFATQATDLRRKSALMQVVRYDARRVMRHESIPIVDR